MDDKILEDVEKAKMKKKVLYVDMDNVLVDFQSGIDALGPEEKEMYKGAYDNCPHIFAKMLPVKDAIKSYEALAREYDTYILSTAPWDNPTALNDKLAWVRLYLGEVAYKRVIFSHHKHLNKGDYLVDDRTKNGADRFEGELIQFGSERFPDWGSCCSLSVVGWNSMQNERVIIREHTAAAYERHQPYLCSENYMGTL